MSYCFNPFCQTPFNPQDAQVCNACGASLLLNNRYIAVHPLRDRCATFLAMDTTQPMRPLRVIQPIALQEDAQQFTSRHDCFPLHLLAPRLHRLLELGLHPQIPKLITQFVQNDRRYLVQEFIEGRSLAQELALEGCFTEIKVRRLLAELLPILQFIHRHQLAHGDIKPANLIRRCGTTRLFLVDLRSVRACKGVSQSPQIIHLQSHNPVQTRWVMPFIADLQSLGATCIHLLTQIPIEQLLDTTQHRFSLQNSLPWPRFLHHPVNPGLIHLINTLYATPLTGDYTSPLRVLEELERSRSSEQYWMSKPQHESVWKSDNPSRAASRNEFSGHCSPSSQFHPPSYLPPSEAFVGSVDETLPPNWWRLN